MSYTSKNPRFDSTILTDIAAGTPANPASGSHKLIDRSGVLYIRDSAGVESTVGAGSTATPSVTGLVTSFTPIIKSSVHPVSSAGYSITDTDGYDAILMTTGNTDRQVDLPTAANNTGRQVFIQKVDSGTGKVTVDGASSETINGALTNVLTAQYAFVRLVCDGSGWLVMSTWDQISLVTSNTINIASLENIGSFTLQPGSWITAGQISIASASFNSANILELIAVVSTVTASFGDGKSIHTAWQQRLDQLGTTNNAPYLPVSARYDTLTASSIRYVNAKFQDFVSGTPSTATAACTVVATRVA